MRYSDRGDYQDEPEDEEQRRPSWIAPEDRLWRHPTEVPLLGRSCRTGDARRSERKPDRRPLWAAMAKAGFAGAALTTAAYALSTAFLASPPARVSAGRAMQIRNADAASASPATLAVAMGSAAGTGSPATREVARVSAITEFGTLTGTALAVGPPGLFMTASRLVASGTVAISLPDRTGRGWHTLPADLVGTDPETGIAVVSVAPTMGWPPPSYHALVVHGTNVPYVGERVTVIGTGGNGDDPIVDARGNDAKITSIWVNLSAPDGSLVLGASQISMLDGRPALGSVLLGPADSVVGMVTYCDKCMTPVGDGSSGVSTTLATPIATAEAAADAIASGGAVPHGWLGVGIQQAIDATGLPAGVVVNQVQPSGPAGQNGVLPGDEIVAIDGESVGSVLDMEADISLRAPGTPVVLTILRGEDTVSLVVPLG